MTSTITAYLIHQINHDYDAPYDQYVMTRQKFARFSAIIPTHI